MSWIKLQSEYDDLDKYNNVNGDIYYVKKNTNIYHNPYGPAFTTKGGNKYYYINDKRHRLDGPAVIYYNQEEYFINDKWLTKEDFEYHPDRLKFLGKEHLICLK